MQILFLLLGLLAAAPAANITLTVTGPCPGRADFLIQGATPSDLVVLAFGPAGSSTRPRNPCAGMTLPISHPRLGGVLPSNVIGVAFVQLTLPPGACGKTVVAVDVATCTVSPPVVL